nr:T9SS type A sorting domain-containing protein [candidate division Zixibacteria bacterium]
MKRVLFTLVFASLLLSFGLAYGMSIVPSVPDSFKWDDGGTMKIKAGQEFYIDISIANSGSTGDPDTDKAGISMPFQFYGTGAVVTANHVDKGYEWPASSMLNGVVSTGDGSLLLMNGFQVGGFWTLGNFFFAFGWDGTLPDTLNYSGAGFPGFVVNHTGTDTPTGLERLRIFLNVPMAVDEEGEICIDSCAHIPDQDPDGKLNWLFDPPLPEWTQTCWPVKFQPDPLPTFTNCPPVDDGIQFDVAYSYDFNAVDGTPVTPGGVTFAMISGPGGIDATSGLYEWDPACADVGSNDVVVGVTDAAHAGTYTDCAFTITVENTAPEIQPPAKDTISVGTEGVATVVFTSNDVNIGDTEEWSTSDGVIVYDGVTGKATLTYTAPSAAGDYSVTVTVEDCAGDTDTYTVVFHVISAVPYDIVIEKVHGQHQGVHGYISVFKGDGSEDMFGWDFLIGYDQSALTFIGAIKGAIFTDPAYDWEYFTYRYNYNGNCGSACPSGLLRVVAMAESNDGPNHPEELFIPDYDPCTFEDSLGILFTLDFLISSDYNFQSQFAPVSFYWMDCGDNTIAYNPSELDDENAVYTAVADEVYAYGGDDETIYCETYRLMVIPTSMSKEFPTYYGADVVGENCLDDAGVYPPGHALAGEPKPAPVPFIRFFNGGFDIIPVSELDDRGDVNLNGIPNEIADAVVFTNYFIVGYNAFTINIDGQAAATEVNGDGVALTVADLVYLIRVIIGDALPLPAAKINPGLVAEVIDANDAIIVNAELGAAQFVLEGNVDVTLGSGAAGMEMISAVRDNNTYVLVYSMEKGMSASGEILITNGNLISMEAANYDGFAYTTKIIPAEFALNNYPNPFNPMTTIALSLPVASNYNVGIFNVVGQKVGEFSGHSEAGTVNLVWDASNQASGIYFYKAEAGKYSVTKKMVLIK